MTGLSAGLIAVTLLLAPLAVPPRARCRASGCPTSARRRRPAAPGGRPSGRCCESWIRRGSECRLRNPGPKAGSNRLPSLPAELVRLPVDVLVTGGGEAADAVKQPPQTIPIVIATGADPVQRGLVGSRARPGGNVTGVSSLASALTAKRLELLKEFLPRVSRVAIVSDDTRNSRTSVQETEAAARTRRIEAQSFATGDPAGIDGAFRATRPKQVGALVVVASPALFPERQRLADLTLSYRLPTALGGPAYAAAGPSSSTA